MSKLKPWINFEVQPFDKFQNVYKYQKQIVYKVLHFQAQICQKEPTYFPFFSLNISLKNRNLK